MWNSLFPNLGGSDESKISGDNTHLKLNVQGIKIQSDMEKYLKNNSQLTNTATKGATETAAKKAAEIEGHNINIGLKSKYQLMAAQAYARAESIQMQHAASMARIQGQVQSQRINHGQQMRELGLVQSMEQHRAETLFHVLDHGSANIAQALLGG